MELNKNDLRGCLDDKARTTQQLVAGDSARCCVDCDAPIPADRLEAVPETKRCIDCQRDIERSGQWDWGMAE